MKVRGWLLVLVFVHVMLHPWVHAIGAPIPVGHHTPIATSSSTLDSGLVTGDQCELCRLSHSTVVLLRLPTSDLLNPRWIRTTLQAVNYASLQAERSLPSRAPPTV